MTERYMTRAHEYKRVTRKSNPGKELNRFLKKLKIEN